MSTALAIAAALLLDRLFGEPRRWHPLVGFGRLAGALERRWNRPPPGGVLPGLAALLLLVLPPVALAAVLQAGAAAWPVGVLLLYLAIGQRSLEEHARTVAAALDAGDLAAARLAVGRLVSRDTAQLDADGVAGATVESVLENGNDALFGALFWFLVAGAPGVVLYRLVNTLDAMWGYRTPRFLRFGRAAARLDDLLNWLPARLTALGYALLGDGRRAWRCWRAQAPAWKSPNAGPVMAAGAGALGVRLGGPARYHGDWQPRPPLGAGHAPHAADIGRALGLVRQGAWLWLGLAAAGGWILA
ncbi:adenosylcobinamide-phosphate synthase CbiB [Thiohalobacter sp. IOR34]|uniref:adenosylcobinamide-phosphate synthase CbiB n=1 Tax=Thiohalobacter sp. IOR34 TaxID=3057176 RepID=UPI0025B17746|nr:adenosylcobinamide-phosphate synthase CbiB [Thiohalobacter sp. IOR34]WJW75156.1 adenosylcobinamide-phosphate synthase CbiB [Thiohalobacter sp. IOR34]